MQAESEIHIRDLCQHHPQVVSSDEISSVTDEWKLYSLDDTISPGTAGTTDDAVATEVKLQRVDEYWASVLTRCNITGGLKYAMLGKAVKAALALSHGNADSERGFSVNKRLLTADRASMSSETINACRLIKDALHNIADGESVNIVVTPALLQSCRSANAVYKQYLEDERKQKEDEQRKIMEEQQK